MSTQNRVNIKIGIQVKQSDGPDCNFMDDIQVDCLKSLAVCDSDYKDKTARIMVDKIYERIRPLLDQLDIKN